MHNRKVLKTATEGLTKAKAPAKPKDIIRDPLGQWKYPGQNTRIPASNITMKGVNYPVLGQPNVGQPQMMYPGQEYQFPGADYVDEFPQLTQAKKGGSLKKYSRSLEAQNKLFRESPLLKKVKSKKKKIFDPNSKYFQSGGEHAATMQWLNEHPYMTDKGKPVNLKKLKNLDVTGYPRMNNDRIFIPQAGTYSPEDYKLATPTEGYSGLPLYEINGKYVSIDKDFNKQYFNMSQRNRIFGKDELYPMYGRGEYYKTKEAIPQEEDGGFIELDLTPDEIKMYKDGGYIIEELPKAQLAGQFNHPNAGATNILFQKPAPVKPNSKYNSNVPVDYQSRLKPEVSESTKVVGSKSQAPQQKTPLGDLNDQKNQADFLIQNGKAARYLGDKYYNQKGDPKELTELMLREIQKNPNIQKDIDANEYKLFLERDKKARAQQNLGYTIANNVSSFMVDPITTGANWMKGEGAMMDQGTVLHDQSNPDYANYMKATGADQDIAKYSNMLNPLGYVGDANVQAKQGDYLGAALSLSDAFGVGKMLKPMAKGIAPSINKLATVTKNTATTILPQVKSIAQKLDRYGRNLIDSGYTGLLQKSMLTTSPANLIPMGKKLKGAHIPLGDVLENSVKNSNVSLPQDPLYSQFNKVLPQRLKFKQKPLSIKNSKNRSSDIFAAEFNPNAPGTNLSLSNNVIPRSGDTFRNFAGKLTPRYNPTRNASRNIIDNQGLVKEIPLTDPSISLKRRLPFSRKYVNIDPEKLMNNEFQMSTMGSGPQALAEKYASTALGTGLVASAIVGSKGNYGNTFIEGVKSATPDSYLTSPTPYYIPTLYDAGKLVYDETTSEPEEKQKGGAFEIDADEDMINYLISQGYTVEEM